MCNKNEYEALASDTAKKIVASIREKTAVWAYKISIIKDSKPSIFESKFGGIPYWDMSKEYPKDSAGNGMLLLAQLNFTKEKLESDLLPKQGMLQFFISCDEDGLFGADYDVPTSQKDFRVVFHETIDETVTEEQVRALDIPSEEDDGWSPILKEAAVGFCKEIAYMGADVAGFNSLFRQAVKEQTEKDISGQSPYRFLSENDWDYMSEELCNVGHWMLGYPFFTQYDPREELAQHYDILLLQIDSEMIDGEDYVLWGDCGVANFFINKDDLKRKEFGNVWYHWDCC